MNKGVGILKKTLILSRKFILLVLCSLAIFFALACIQNMQNVPLQARINVSALLSHQEIQPLD